MDRHILLCTLQVCGSPKQSIICLYISVNLIAPTQLLPFSRNALEATRTSEYTHLRTCMMCTCMRGVSRRARYVVPKISNIRRVGRLQEPHWSTAYFYPSMLATLELGLHCGAVSGV